MNLQTCYSLVDALISKVDSIISKGASSRDKYVLDGIRDVNVQTCQLIRTLYPDADKRLNDLEDSRKKAEGREGFLSIMEQAKVYRRYLVSIRDSLRLRESVEKGETKLGELKKEVEEKEVEAKRREAVTETKFYGAAIEIIDRLREQLRDRGNMEQEIIKIRSELTEIKELLKGLRKESADQQPIP